MNRSKNLICLFVLLLISLNPVLTQTPTALSLETNSGQFRIDSIANAFIFNNFGQIQTSKYLYDYNLRITSIKMTNNTITYDYSKNREIRTFRSLDGTPISIIKTRYNDDNYIISQYFQSFSEYEIPGFFQVDSFIRNESNMILEHIIYAHNNDVKQLRNSKKYTYNQRQQLLEVNQLYYHNEKVIADEKTVYTYYDNDLLRNSILTSPTSDYVYTESKNYDYDQENRIILFQWERFQDNVIIFGDSTLTSYDGNDSTIDMYRWDPSGYSLFSTEDRIGSETPYFPFSEITIFESDGISLHLTNKEMNIVVEDTDELIQLRRQRTAIHQGSISQAVSKLFYHKRQIEVNKELPIFKISPSPCVANSSILVQSENIESDAYILYDMQGQTVAREPKSIQSQIILQSPPSAGTYYLVLLNNGARVSKAIPFIVVE